MPGAVELDDILFDEGENMGGNTAVIRFAPLPWVALLPVPIQGVVHADMQLQPGRTIRRMVVTAERRDWRETESQGAGGPVWRVEYSVFVPRVSVERKQRLLNLALHDMVIEVRDNNGVQRRMGDLRNPVRPVVTFSTGQGSAATNGAEVRFSWTHDAPAPIIDTTHEVDLSHL